MRKRFLVLGSLAVFSLSGYGILLRNDPMYANDKGVVEHAACTYFVGWRIKTIYLENQTQGASCHRWQYVYDPVQDLIALMRLR